MASKYYVLTESDINSNEGVAVEEKRVIEIARKAKALYENLDYEGFTNLILEAEKELSDDSCRILLRTTFSESSNSDIMSLIVRIDVMNSEGGIDMKPGDEINNDVVLTTIDTWPIFDEAIDEDEMYKRGCSILLEEGFTQDEIASFERIEAYAAYAEHEFMEGRARELGTVSLILESGECVESKPVFRYFGETYAAALKRELDASGESYDPNDILKSAVVDA
jgi:hypothetical protein